VAHSGHRETLTRAIRTSSALQTMYYLQLLAAAQNHPHNTVSIRPSV